MHRQYKKGNHQIHHGEMTAEPKKTEYLFYVLPLFRTKTELDSHG
jgi:hypothetical protein